VRGRYAAQRPRFDEVQEVEVSQTGKGLARGTIDRARVDSAGQRRQHTRGRWSHWALQDDCSDRRLRQQAQRDPADQL